MQRRWVGEWTTPAGAGAPGTQEARWGGRRGPREPLGAGRLARARVRWGTSLPRGPQEARMVTTDPQPLPGGKPSGNGGCCRPSPCPAASRADREPRGLAPMGQAPRTLPGASPGHPEGGGSLFHFPKAREDRRLPSPVALPPCPTALGQDSGLLGCGASPWGRGGKAGCGRSCLPRFSLLAAGARSLQACGAQPASR